MLHKYAKNGMSTFAVEQADQQIDFVKSIIIPNIL